MRYSHIFPKTLKNVPAGVDAINHQLLVKGGFVHQEMAGVYSYLPLGWRVINKISTIVREEMNAIGGQELVMSSLHPGENWKKTGRFNSFDVLFKLKGAGSSDFVLGPTHEEIIYPLTAEFVKSYKDLPLYLYQIQTKFRNEVRAKAGLLRGREFLMKDLYSFHINDKDRNDYYEKVREAYIKIFDRIGLPIVVTKAGGGTFSEVSQEFQTLTPSGEDLIYICKKCKHAINKEVFNEKKCPECGGEFEAKKAIEVGNIFPLKDSFAETFGLKFMDKDGKEQVVSAGCYGLGISRTMGAIVEVFADSKGIIWPESVAPFKVHLVGLDLETESVKGKAESVYKKLESENIEVLFDDRVEVSAGEKFADADLIGIPYKVVISKKTEGEKYEFKERKSKDTRFYTLEELISEVK